MTERDPQILVDAIGRAATDVGRSSALLLTVCLIFLATIIETSHQDIFLNTSKPLPQIGTRLPLVGIFVVVPLAIALLHGAALLQVRNLLLRVHELLALVRDRPERDTIMDQLPTALVVQWAVAGVQRRDRSSHLLSLLVAFTLVGVPLGTLLLAQLRFLPFHDPLVTWLHRGLILIDVVTIWAMLHVAWRGAAPAAPIDHRLQPTRTWSLLNGCFAGVVLAVAFVVATLPDEHLERALVSASAATVTRLDNALAGGPPPAEGAALVAEDITPSASDTPACSGWTLNPLRLFAVTSVGEAKPRHMLCITYLVAEHPDRSLLFARRNLVLREAAIAISTPSPELIKQVGEAEAWRLMAAAIQVAGRDLRYADLTGTHLPGVNLRGADLRGAKLVYTRLAFAELGDYHAGEMRGCPSEVSSTWKGVTLCNTRLEGADLSNADLRGAFLFKAELDGAKLHQAKILETAFTFADLDGVDLSTHNLTGADLFGARFTRSKLVDTDLRGANLRSAVFIDSDLARARLDGADLRNARFVVGVDDEGRVNGVDGLSLAGADLRDATLVRVDQGWLTEISALTALGSSTFWRELEGVVGEGATSMPVDVALLDLSGQDPRVRQQVSLAVRGPDKILETLAWIKHNATGPDVFAHEKLYASLSRLACSASRDGITTGIARRIAAAAGRQVPRDQFGVWLFEVEVARRLQQQDCAGADALGDAMLCDLRLVEHTWEQQRGTPLAELANRRLPTQPCVVPR